MKRIFKGDPTAIVELAKYTEQEAVLEELNKKKEKEIKTPSQKRNETFYENKNLKAQGKYYPTASKIVKNTRKDVLSYARLAKQSGVSFEEVRLYGIGVRVSFESLKSAYYGLN